MLASDSWRSLKHMRCTTSAYHASLCMTCCTFWPAFATLHKLRQVGQARTCKWATSPDSLVCNLPLLELSTSAQQRWSRCCETTSPEQHTMLPEPSSRAHHMSSPSTGPRTARTLRRTLRSGGRQEGEHAPHKTTCKYSAAENGRMAGANTSAIAHATVY